MRQVQAEMIVWQRYPIYLVPEEPVRLRHNGSEYGSSQSADFPWDGLADGIGGP